MAWLRSREIKPGVWETQSAGRYAAGQFGIVLAIIFGALALLLIVSSWQTLLFVGLPLAALGFWHYRYYKKHPGERPEPRQGPWN
jgi:uncharacterized membrane protein